jgi:hypothetical protein
VLRRDRTECVDSCRPVHVCLCFQGVYLTFWTWVSL